MTLILISIIFIISYSYIATLLYGSEIFKKCMSTLKIKEMKILGRTAEYSLLDLKTKEDILEKLRVGLVENQIPKYKSS